jgi:type I restriction enzyme S subunit
MRKEKLSSLCKVSNGFAFKSDDYVEYGYRVMRITNVQKGIIVDNDPKFVSQEIADKANNFKLRAGDILISLTGNVGRVGRVPSQHLPAVLNQRVGLIRPVSEEINDKYLFQYLNSNKFEQESIQNSNGVAQLNLSSKWIENYEIPLPLIDDQIRIAHLLGKVEGLIAQRKQHLQQLDDLLKSVFLEMFGDPVRNKKGWDIQPCDKVVLDISSGTSYGGEDRAFVSSDEVGVLKISAVTKGTFDPTEFKVVNQAQITKTLRFVMRGDFLFSRANTVELVAACCIVPQDYTRLFLSDKLWVLTLNAKLVISQFFNYLLKNERYRDVVRSLASGGHDSMLNISMKKFMTLGIPCPPIDLQNQFAVIVEKVEGIKSRYQQSLADLEALYGALSQQAFKGELDLSRVPLPVEVTTKDTESREVEGHEIHERHDTQMGVAV